MTKNNNRQQRVVPKKKNKNQNKPREIIVYRDAPQSVPRNSGLGDVGLSVGNFVSKIFGLGAYKIKRNNIYNDLTSGQVPVMHSSSESLKFRHREYIGDVSSSVAFSSTVYPVNPGLDLTFPYLARLAQNFQEYRFNGLIFEFKSTSADALNSTNTALGTIMLAAQYRADASPFVDKQGMLNEMWSCDTKPNGNMILPIECDPRENPMGIQYVRGAGVPAGQDQKLYDLATVTIASVGSQAASVVGELWATYEVELFKPQMGQGLLSYSDSARYILDFTVSSLAPFGSLPAVSYDNIGLSFNGNGLAFTLPKGCSGSYMIFYFVDGNSTAVTGPSITLTNATLSSKWRSSATSENTPAGTTTTKFILDFVINITDSNVATIVTFGAAGTLPASVSGGNVVVSQIAQGTASGVNYW